MYARVDFSRARLELSYLLLSPQDVVLLGWKTMSSKLVLELWQFWVVAFFHSINRGFIHLSKIITHDFFNFSLLFISLFLSNIFLGSYSFKSCLLVLIFSVISEKFLLYLGGLAQYTADKYLQTMIITPQEVNFVCVFSTLYLVQFVRN